MRKKDVKSVSVVCRMSKEEVGNLRRTAVEAGMGVSEFMRLCVAAEIARKTMDPAHLRVLADQFQEGIQSWVRTAVDHEMAKAKKKSG